MIGPHVHIPYTMLRDHIDLINENRLDLELLLTGEVLESLTRDGLTEQLSELTYKPSFTIHAPFMDLSPGAVDSAVREATHKRYSQTFDAAEVIKPRAIVFHSGYEKWKYDLKTDIWLERSLDTWRKFIPRAEKIGTAIAIENIFEDEPSAITMLMKELGSEHFGVCFDTGHYNIFSSVPLSQWLDALVPHFKELHLHDNDKGSDAHLPIGDGTFPFAELFAAIKGREIVPTIEAHTPKDVMTSLSRLAALMGA